MGRAVPIGQQGGAPSPPSRNEAATRGMCPDMARVLEKHGLLGGRCTFVPLSAVEVDVALITARSGAQIDLS